MAIRKRFNESFGLGDSVEEERKRFVARVNQAIFHYVDTQAASELDYGKLFADVCLEYGVDAYAMRRTQPSSGRARRGLPPGLADLTGNDFHATLEVLCCLYAHVGHYKNKGWIWLSEQIQEILSRRTRDIGVRWKAGLFYPSGAEELDKPLIEDVLTWLRNYPNEEKDYRAALHHYMTRDSLPDVVKNCYSAVEGIARTILGNNTRLDRNVDALVAKIGLSEGLKQVVTDYVKYAHDYRHADPARHDITPHEAEAYLYMTGLIIRLAVESKKP